MNPSDLDLLADYAEGLLDGTPEGAAVAARVADDPEWADAYERLSVAAPEITTLLGGLASESIPADVADRLEEAIRGASVNPSPRHMTAPGPTTDLTEPWQHPAGPLSVPAAPMPAAAYAPPQGVDGHRVAGARPVDPEARRRRRRLAVAGWLAGAAAVLVCAAGSVGVILTTQQNSHDDSAASAPQGARSAAPNPAEGSPAPSVSPSPPAADAAGGVYTTDRLGPQARALLEARRSAAADTPALPGPTRSVPQELRRLLDPAARDACLTALGVQPALTVDYGTLDGRPALIAVAEVTGNTAQLLVVAAGPNCGLAGTSDELARTTVAR